jgi:hypothetical protein
MNWLARSSRKAEQARKSGHDGQMFLIEAGSGFKIALCGASMMALVQTVEWTGGRRYWSDDHCDSPIFIASMP